VLPVLEELAENARNLMRNSCLISYFQTGQGRSSPHSLVLMAGTRSSPVLRGYRAETVLEELAENARDLLRATVEVDTTRRKLILPEMFRSGEP
jgi:hypothetical protein